MVSVCFVFDFCLFTFLSSPSHHLLVFIIILFSFTLSMFALAGHFELSLSAIDFSNSDVPLCTNSDNASFHR